MEFDTKNVNYVDDVFTILKEQMTCGLEEYPISFKKVQDGNKKIVLLIGDNMTGKSFYNSIIQQFSSQFLKWHSWNLNMKVRTSRSAYLAMEEIVSTGAGSVSNVLLSIKNTIDRENSKKDKLLILDEPTIGLSERFESAMGVFLSQEIKRISEIESVKGFILTTHSKRLVRKMLENQLDFCVYITGKKYQTLEDWLNDTEEATVEELLALSTQTMETYRNIVNFNEKE